MNLAARCYGLDNLTNKFCLVEIVLDKNMKDVKILILLFLLIGNDFVWAGVVMGWIIRRTKL